MHNGLGSVVFVAQNADARGFGIEVSCSQRRKPQPAGRDHADDLGAGESSDIAVDWPHEVNKSISTSGDLLGRFPVGRAIALEIPVWPRAMHIGGQKPLVVAVVPFRQVWTYLGMISESGKLAGATHA